METRQHESARRYVRRFWETQEWPEEWTQSLGISSPKKGNLKQCQNYRTINLINHFSKIMLRVILNWFKDKTEELLAEEQTGFRQGRSAVKQILNGRVTTEKQLQHQCDLFYNFIDSKGEFDRVWLADLCEVLRSFKTEEGLVQAIQTLYENSSSAILFNIRLREFFKTAVGVRQGCLLSPILLTFFFFFFREDNSNNKNHHHHHHYHHLHHHHHDHDDDNNNNNNNNYNVFFSVPFLLWSTRPITWKKISGRKKILHFAIDH